MAKQVDAGLKEISKTNFYTPPPDYHADDDEVTERFNLAAVFIDEPRPDESLNRLINKL